VQTSAGHLSAAVKTTNPGRIREKYRQVLTRDRAPPVTVSQGSSGSTRKVNSTSSISSNRS